MRLFLPTPRQTNLLIVLGCAAFGYALYLRHVVVDAPGLEAACAAGLPRAICSVRRVVIDLYEMEFFGGTAIAAAVIHLTRPRLAIFTIGLVAAIFGLVLSNSTASALAVGLLVMGFARPVHREPANKSLPARAARARATGPASSKTSR
jgi:hypothetical protein